MLLPLLLFLLILRFSTATVAATDGARAAIATAVCADITVSTVTATAGARAAIATVGGGGIDYKPFPHCSTFSPLLQVVGPQHGDAVLNGLVECLFFFFFFLVVRFERR